MVAILDSTARGRGRRETLDGTVNGLRYRRIACWWGLWLTVGMFVTCVGPVFVQWIRPGAWRLQGVLWTNDTPSENAWMVSLLKNLESETVVASLHFLRGRSSRIKLPPHVGLNLREMMQSGAGSIEESAIDWSLLHESILPFHVNDPRYDPEDQDLCYVERGFGFPAISSSGVIRVPSPRGSNALDMSARIDVKGVSFSTSPSIPAWDALTASKAVKILPGRIIWFGVLMNFVTTVGLGATLHAILHAVRSQVVRRRRRLGQCTVCGYPMPVGASLCPECGGVVESKSNIEPLSSR